MKVIPTQGVMFHEGPAAPNPGGRLFPGSPHLPLPLPSSTFGVHKHEERVCPGLGADLEGRKRSCEFLPAAGITGTAPLQPGAGTHLQPLPIHCGGVELEALAVLGAGAGGGVALGAAAVGLPVLWGTEAGMPKRQCQQPGEADQPQQSPAGSPSLPGRRGALTRTTGGTYQDNWADVGWEQDVVPQWAPVTLWLHVGGALVVELEGQEEGMWNRGQLPCPDQEPRAGHAGTVDVPQPWYSP